MRAVQGVFGFALILLSACATSLKPEARAPSPEGWRAENVEIVGYSDLGGREGALKLAIKRVGEGEEERWYLYVGHLWRSGWSIVEVTDPAAPRYVRFVEGPPNTTTKQVTLHGDLLITGLSPQGGSDDGEGEDGSSGEAGVYLWDVSDPENPQRLSHWSAGPGLGTHRNSYPGGDYAYISTRVPGYRNLVLVILDVSDPRNPRQVGLWAQPGQRLDEPLAQNPRWLGFHGPLTVSADGRTGVAGYAPQVVTLDLSDPSRPRQLGGLTVTPPFVTGGGSSSMHTAYPLWDRNLILVANERHAENCDEEAMSLLGFVDASDSTAPRLISMFPTPQPPAGEAYGDFCDKNGRFGPHNISMETHSPDVQPIEDLLYVTYFNAGLRVFDIRDPRRVSEVGYFIPPTPTERVGPRPRELEASSEDVLVDARGYAYVSDKQWGVWIVRYNGPLADERDQLTIDD